MHWLHLKVQVITLSCLDFIQSPLEWMERLPLTLLSSRSGNVAWNPRPLISIKNVCLLYSIDSSKGKKKSVNQRGKCIFVLNLCSLIPPKYFLKWSFSLCVCVRPATFIDISQKNIKQITEHAGGQEHPFPDLCPSCAIVQNQTNTVRASSKWMHPTHASCHKVLDHLVQAMKLLLEPQTIILAISWHLNSPTPKRDHEGEYLSTFSSHSVCQSPIPSLPWLGSLLSCRKWRHLPKSPKCSGNFIES